MQLEFCHTALSFRVIKTSLGLGATQLRVEASFGRVGRRTKGAAMQLPRLATDCGNESTLKWFTDSSLVKLIGEDDKRSTTKDDYHSNASNELPLIVVSEFQRNV